jgi:2'-5' RNA ligase
VSELDAALEREFKKEKREFTPHLTIARFDPTVQIPEDALATTIPKTTFSIDRLILYRSFLQRPAPRYEPVGEFVFDAR